MISSFQLKFGRVPSGPAEQIAVTPVTVFVGPNNSGKSRVLSEIERYCRTGNNDANALLLSELNFIGLPAETATRAIDRITVPPNPGESAQIGHIFVASRHARFQVPADQIFAFVQSPSQNLPAFCTWFLTHNTLILDGRNRIDLVNDQGAGDLQRPAQSCQTSRSPAYRFRGIWRALRG
jgi:hypothetical protein